MLGPGSLILQMSRQLSAENPREEVESQRNATDAIVATIQITDLYKTYQTRTGPTVALQRVDLTIRQNEFVTLVGPSGCGKSTLLKIIDLLIAPSRGAVFFDGRPLAAPSRDVGMVFLDIALWTHMTVQQNLMFGLIARKVEKREADDRVQEILNRVGLQNRSDA